LSTARQLHTAYPEYLWYPSVLANASHSGEHLARELATYLRQNAPSSTQLRQFISEKLILSGLGIHDATAFEIDALVEHADPFQAAYLFADMVSRRAQNGWSTHGHSGVDVNIYSSDARYAAGLVGNHENTDVGHFLKDYLELDLEPVTQELRKKGIELQSVGESWLGKHVGEKKHIDHVVDYHGEFKRDLEWGHVC
jgi:alkaline phosphatase